MEPLMFLPILLLTTCADTGVATITKYEIYQAVGSSLTFPAVNITKETLYDLTRFGQKLLLTYHGIENVRPPFRQRAEFYSRIGTFVLRNLTADDSGAYQQVVNMEIVSVIYLHVIEPVNEPTLRKVNETINGTQCNIILECSVQGPKPLNVTLLKDGEEITENITKMDNSSYLSLDAWDPGSHGTYSCKLGNPLGDKTSSGVKVPTLDNTCRKATSHLWIWIIVPIIILILSFIIGGGFIVYKNYRTRNGRQPNHNPGDEVSGHIGTPEEPLRPLNEDDQSEEERNRVSYRNVPTNDVEESGNDVTLDMGLELPTEEDITNSLDSGHCRQDDSFTLELEVNRVTSDHG